MTAPTTSPDTGGEADGPPHIWLEPSCCADPMHGRCWSEDGAFPICEGPAPIEPTKYVRADLATPRKAEGETTQPLSGAFITTESKGNPDAEKRRGTLKFEFAGEGCIDRMHAAEDYLKRLVDEDRLATPTPRKAEGGSVVVPREPTPEMLEPFARVLCSALNLDPDEPEAPHGEWPTWYGQCGPLAVAYRDALAAAPPAVGEGS